MKRKINNLCSAGIIYRATDPTQIFIEAKDDTHPLLAFRNQLCPIGGNWIGNSARRDKNPYETFKREIREELVLRKNSAHNLELLLLGFEKEKKVRSIHRRKVIITKKDKGAFKIIKSSITNNAQPFGDFLITISKALMKKNNYDQPPKENSFICSYYSVALPEDIWKKVIALQKKFGNLSGESITLVTSIDEITKKGIKTAFGHDQVLKKFFSLQGLKGLKKFPVIKNIKTKFLGLPLKSYREYLAKYRIIKNPLLIDIKTKNV